MFQCRSREELTCIIGLGGRGHLCEGVVGESYVVETGLDGDFIYH